MSRINSRIVRMIKENLALCLQGLEIAGQKAGISISDITLVAVTKKIEPPFICESIDCGIRHIGESRVQEALLKYKYVNEYTRAKNLHLMWHMIGHLQTNKVKEAVQIFDLIHSVDSLRVAGEIDKQAALADKIQDVLLEVNVCGESTKYGFTTDAIFEAVRQITALKHVCVKGLMTIAPESDEAEKARPYFRRLRQLRDEINRLRASDFGLRILSMGMTDDFKVAIEEGSNMVRIGRGIFNERIIQKG